MTWILSLVWFLSVSNQEKIHITKKIATEPYSEYLYRFQFFLSCIIATLWLYINSIPVVIGAMLVSPIIKPLIALSFAVATWNKNLYIRSLNTVFFSVVLGVLLSWIVSYLVPFAHFTSEIVARTSSTFLDILIAFASGIIAVMALRYKSFSDSLAGVAMATSLVPPLCVIGISIFLGDMDKMRGSLLLFSANLVTLLFVWFVIFVLYGFRPHTLEKVKLRYTRGILLVVTIVLISFPLWQSMDRIAYDYALNTKMKKNIQSFFVEKDKDIVIQNIQYTDQNIKLYIDLSLAVPDYLVLKEEDISGLQNVLSDVIAKPVVIKTHIVRVSSPSAHLDIEESPLEKDIVKQFYVLFSWSNIISLYVHATGNIYTINLRFETNKDAEYVAKIIPSWKVFLEKYYSGTVNMNVEAAYASYFHL